MKTGTKGLVQAHKDTKQQTGGWNCFLDRVSSTSLPPPARLCQDLGAGSVLLTQGVLWWGCGNSSVFSALFRAGTLSGPFRQLPLVLRQASCNRAIRMLYSNNSNPHSTVRRERCASRQMYVQESEGTFVLLSLGAASPPWLGWTLSLGYIHALGCQHWADTIRVLKIPRATVLPT